MSTDDIQYYSVHTYNSEYGGSIHAFRTMKMVTLYGVDLGSTSAPPENTDWLIQTLDEIYRPIFSVHCLGLTSEIISYDHLITVTINTDGVISTYTYDIYSRIVLSFCASYIVN